MSIADEKMVTLTCAQGHENARALPYDMKLLDWCSTCGQVFGDGERDPPRYMPACALADPQGPQAADTIERQREEVDAANAHADELEDRAFAAEAEVERLQARVGVLEAERDEAVNWSAIVDRHGCDGFDALGDTWLAMESVQRMHKAVSSVFAKHASDEIMTRFREHMTTIMHQAFVEGCLVGVRAEMAANLTKEG